MAPDLSPLAKFAKRLRMERGETAHSARVTAHTEVCELSAKGI
jgi:hypothetical protein